jgi:hypothetical protein
MLANKLSNFLTHRGEPVALEGWILKILCCGLKNSRAFLQMRSTEGRGIGVC